MSKPLTIALDAMGGDLGPRMVVRGANIARKRYPNVRFLFYGLEAEIKPLLDKHKTLRGLSEIRPAETVVTTDAKPSQALRTGRKSSMRLAIDAVAAHEAGCAVSAGNTGALMAMAKFVLKTMPGIDRPAIASFFPTLRGESVMLDLGANIQCDARNLAQFAIMGEVFARTVLGTVHPTVGLLNVGTEDLKGSDTLREAASMLRSMQAMNFHGFIEGDDIAGGTVDVVVTDGFSGNIALKTAEGTARLYTEFLRRAFRHSLISKLGYVFARPAFNKLKSRVDPRRYNGAMFLGLNGICVKSHGGTDAKGFANAIGVAVDMCGQSLITKIRDELEALQTATAPVSEGAATA